MEPGEVIAQRFEIQALAGTGGMSQVFRAWDRLSGEPVALKVLPENRRADAERLRRESRVLAELSHPAIVRYIDHGTTPDGHPYLVMEWLEGETLSQRLTRAGLTVLETLSLARRIASALASAHARGLIHRDIKPSNLFLPDRQIDQVKILDFGIVRLSGADLALTQTGAVLGTPRYMAPEQARMDKDLDARADLFSMGCVLYECLTGRPAFDGRHAMAILAKILLEEAPRVSALRPDVPPELDRLVARLLEKAPGNRPPDGGAVLAELAALESVGEARPAPIAQPVQSLTTSEQRLLSVVLVGLPWAGGEDATLPASGTSPLDRATVSRAREAVRAHGGRLEQLADGSLLVALAGTGIATDEAAQAARCALALRRLLPAHPIALKTGRGEFSGTLAIGEVIDWAAHLLSPGTAPPAGREGGAGLPIWLDSVTAGLLDSRFIVATGPAGLELQGEQEPEDTGRLLLGKPTPCIGRDREVLTLEAVFAECAAEPVARPVLLAGTAGVGKSRVRQEFLQRLGRRPEPPEILSGRGDPIRLGVPFGLLAPAIRRAAGIRGDEPPAVRRGKLLARVSRVIPEAEAARVAAFLGELSGIPDDGSENVQLEAARRNAVLMGDQIRRAWEDWLAAECRRKPLVLILEDLQWGDLPSIKLVDAALRHLADAPLMVLALARPEVHEQFPGLWEDRRLEEIQLKELSRKSSERLVREVLGSQATPALSEHLATQSGGNPFFLEELIRAAAGGEIAGLPETVLAMAESRFAGLEPEVRRILRAASLFGQRFRRQGVQALLPDLDEEFIEEWLVELVRQEILQRLWDEQFLGDELYAFRHSLHREAVYATLTGTDRIRGHRLAGEWLERSGETQPAVLAEHFEQGGEPSRAVRWYIRAAEQELHGNDFTAALARIRRGESCGAAGAALGDLHLLQAEAHHWRGEAVEAESCAEEAMARLPGGSANWHAAAALLATTAGRRADTDRLVRLAEELLAAGESRDGAAVIAIASTAVALFHAGRYEFADTLLGRLGAPEAAPPEDPVRSAWITRAHAIRSAYQGDNARSLRWMEESARHFERAGDLRTACQQWGNVGYLKRELGLFEEGAEALRAVLGIAERMGLHHIIPTVKHNLGLTLAWLGEPDEGALLEAEAARVFEAQGDRRFEGASRIYLARIHLLRNDPDAAEPEARAAIRVLEHTPQARAFAQAVLAEILARLDRPEEGLAEARRGLAILAEVGGTDEGETFIHLVAAEAMIAAGETAEALRILRDARDRLLARAGAVGEPDWRDSFLHRIQENRRLLELATEWLPAE